MNPISRYTRTEKLLAGLDVATTSGLEIGPLTTPILRPPQARIRYVDHADQQTLRAKYANDPNVNIADIVPVDAVWANKTLAECFPNEQFDYVIASHVIEHVPDVIRWLVEIAAILRPDGRLILAVPDRRTTYDILRRETTLADLIDANFRAARRPTPGQVFDCKANVAAFTQQQAWAATRPNAPPARFASLAYALSQAEQSRDGAHIDCHCSVFTARSLLSLLDNLLEFKLLPYRLERFHIACAGSNEMSLILRREPRDAAPGAARAAIQALLQSGTDTEGLSLDAPNPPGDPRVAHLQQALWDMQSSTSWRITAPLRALMRKVRGY
jgi:SAM-dependent methyltransferase